MLEAAVYLTAATLFGAALAAFYYSARLRDGEQVISNQLVSIGQLIKDANFYRSEANILAAEVRRLRGLVPQRDPRTNRFVKRSNGAGLNA